VSAFARTCANMLMDLSPGSGDNADYVKHLDVSGKFSVFLPRLDTRAKTTNL